MEKVIIIGCGGHAKSVIDVIEVQKQYEIVGLIDTKLNSGFLYRGYRIIGTDDDLIHLYKSGIKYAFVSIGYLGKNNIRERLYERITKIGFTLITVVDPSAIIAKDVEVGEGTFIGKSAVINSNTVIEKMAIINSGAIIEHDCHIRAYTHVAVGSILCGHVQIGERCLVGAGATIIQDKCIGNNCILAAATVVVKDLPDNSKAIGHPARLIGEYE